MIHLHIISRNSLRKVGSELKNMIRNTSLELAALGSIRTEIATLSLITFACMACRLAYASLEGDEHRLNMRMMSTMSRSSQQVCATGSTVYPHDAQVRTTILSVSAWATK